MSDERILYNSIQLKTTPEEELHRVMIHGVMHLCGFKDKKPKERSNMTKKEDQYLEAFSLLNK